jgi:outer membrane biosynthesis protein TonB
MAGTGNKIDSLRPNRFEGERVLLALAISVFLHALIFWGYELYKEAHWIPRLPWFNHPKPPHFIIQQTEQPLEFVTVANPSTEVPKNTKYYSNRNAVAADASENKNTPTPQLNGRSDMPDTVDESHLQVSKSAVGADQHQVNPNNSQESQPQSKPSETPGDLTLGKPDNAQQPQPRPRTLKQAYEEMKNRVPQMTMREQGGVQRHNEISSFDVKLTGFGDYDAQLIDTIRQNWFNELDSHQFSQDRVGRVELEFVLNSDGRVSQMRVVGSTVGDLLSYVCEKAVLEGAPYGPWTEDMRRTLGESRDMTFTFEYLGP